MSFFHDPRPHFISCIASVTAAWKSEKLCPSGNRISHVNGIPPSSDSKLKMMEELSCARRVPPASVSPRQKEKQNEGGGTHLVTRDRSVGIESLTDPELGRALDEEPEPVEGAVEADLDVLLLRDKHPDRWVVQE